MLPLHSASYLNSVYAHQLLLSSTVKVGRLFITFVCIDVCYHWERTRDLKAEFLYTCISFNILFPYECVFVLFLLLLFYLCLFYRQNIAIRNCPKMEFLNDFLAFCINKFRVNWYTLLNFKIMAILFLLKCRIYKQ